MTALPRRDRLAWALCTLVLRHIATEKYRAFVHGSILYGLRSAARDSRTGAPAPPPLPPLRAPQTKIKRQENGHG